MTTEEIKELIIEMIACKEFKIIEENQMRPVFDDFDEDEYGKEYTISLDLSDFTDDEKDEISKIKEVEFEGDYYYPQYQTLGKNKKEIKNFYYIPSTSTIITLKLFQKYIFFTGNN